MKILITNVYGIKNKGDQALFEDLLRTLNECLTDVTLRAVATNPKDNEHEYPMIQWIGLPWSSLRESVRIRSLEIVIRMMIFIFLDLICCSRRSRLASAVMDCDAIVACPGGYLEDSSFSYWSHMLQLFVGIRFGKPVILAPQSIGPVRHGFGRFCCAFLLKRSRAVFCRDEYSYLFTKKLVGEEGRDRIFRTSDLVVTCGAPESFPVRNYKTVGITLIDWSFYGDSIKRNSYLNAVAKTTEWLRDLGYKVIIIQQTIGRGGDDLAVSDFKKLVDCDVLPQPQSLTDFLDAFREVDFLIGSRLHSCLLALNAGVPVVSISYLPKCEQIMGDLGLADYVVDINSIDYTSLKKTCSKLMNGTESYEEKLSLNRARWSSSFEHFRDALRGVENRNG